MTFNGARSMDLNRRDTVTTNTKLKDLIESQPKHVGTHLYIDQLKLRLIIYYQYISYIVYYNLS